MFELEVKQLGIRVRSRELLTSGGRNTALCRFIFEKDWDGLSKTAVFLAGDREIGVLLEADDSCTIPWEALQEPVQELKVGIYGTLGEETVKPTVYASLGPVLRGANPGEAAQQPPADVYAQILAAARNAQALAQSVRDDADAGKFQGQPGEPGRSVPADWNQNDMTAPDYIKNKPFGAPDVLIFDGTVVADENDEVLLDFKLEPDQEYRVTVNGTQFTNRCQTLPAEDGLMLYWIGNSGFLTGVISEEPYIILTQTDGVQSVTVGLFVDLATGNSLQGEIALQVAVPGQVQIPVQYLPGGIGYETDTPELVYAGATDQFGVKMARMLEVDTVYQVIVDGVQYEGTTKTYEESGSFMVYVGNLAIMTGDAAYDTQEDFLLLTQDSELGILLGVLTPNPNGGTGNFVHTVEVYRKQTVHKIPEIYLPVQCHQLSYVAGWGIQTEIFEAAVADFMAGKARLTINGYPVCHAAPDESTGDYVLRFQICPQQLVRFKNMLSGEQSLGYLPRSEPFVDAAVALTDQRAVLLGMEGEQTGTVWFYPQKEGDMPPHILMKTADGAQRYFYPLPKVTTADNGKYLCVVDGGITWVNR